MERRIIYGTVAVATAICAGAYLALKPLVDVSKESQISSSNTDPLATPTKSEGQGETIVNGMTGAIFDVTSDPEGLGRQCAQLGHYSPSNKQDVTGAAVALGSDPGVYVDVRGGVVYAADRKTVIGNFSHSQLPSNDLFGIVSPGTVVCAN